MIKTRLANDTQLIQSQHPHSGCGKARDPNQILAAAVTSKIEEGNLRAAVRILCSDERPAVPSLETIAKLRSKHFVKAADEREPPPLEQSSLTVDKNEVLRAIRSFPNGSSGGTDGFRPQFLKDLVNCHEISESLLESLTELVNLILSGCCPVSVQPFLFGGRLLALAKRDGGIRPIAVGMVWRRLVAKCAAAYATTKTAHELEPRQVGVGVRGGAEAAVHATRRFLSNMPLDHVIAKFDFSNAFNTLRRDCMLEAVKQACPEDYNFCRLSYENRSYLFYEDHIISSEVGPQQGDPIGPLLFGLTIQPILQGLQSQLAVGYLDDLTAAASKV